MIINIDLLSLPGAREITDDDDNIGIFIPYIPSVEKREGKHGDRGIVSFDLVHPQVPQPTVRWFLKLRVPNQYKERFFFSKAIAKARNCGVAVDTEVSTIHRDSLEDVLNDL